MQLFKILQPGILKQLKCASACEWCVCGRMIARVSVQSGDFRGAAAMISPATVRA